MGMFSKMIEERQGWGCHTHEKAMWRHPEQENKCNTNRQSSLPRVDGIMMGFKFPKCLKMCIVDWMVACKCVSAWSAQWLGVPYWIYPASCPELLRMGSSPFATPPWLSGMESALFSCLWHNRDSLTLLQCIKPLSFGTWILNAFSGRIRTLIRPVLTTARAQFALYSR